MKISGGYFLRVTLLMETLHSRSDLHVKRVAMTLEINSFHCSSLGHRKNRVLGLPTLRGVHIQGLTTNCPAWISSKKS